jgi:hypothetical protein
MDCIRHWNADSDESHARQDPPEAAGLAVDPRFDAVPPSPGAHI